MPFIMQSACWPMQSHELIICLCSARRSTVGPPLVSGGISHRIYPCLCGPIIPYENMHLLISFITCVSNCIGLESMYLLSDST